jgi:hypothetical protein
MTSVTSRVLIARMEAAHRQSVQHLDLICRQIARRAERLTIAEKSKSRSGKRTGSRWTRSDEQLYQHHVDRLTFERRSEIEALSRKLKRQEVALDDAQNRHGGSGKVAGRR